MVGGIGSLAGSVVGGVFYVLVDNSAQAISTCAKEPSPCSTTFVLATTVVGILLLLMYLMPMGIAGGAAKLRDALYWAWLPRQARNPLPEPAADTAALATASDEKQSEGAR